MKEIGETIKCTVKVLSSGPMEEFTLATTFKIKNMVSVLSSGPTVKYTKDTGNKESKTEKEKLEDLMAFKGRASGKMVTESSDDINFCYFDLNSMVYSYYLPTHQHLI